MCSRELPYSPVTLKNNKFHLKTYKQDFSLVRTWMIIFKIEDSLVMAIKSKVNQT